MSHATISRRRTRSGKATLLALGVVFLKVLPPESQPLTRSAQLQMMEYIDRLEPRVKIAVEAIDMMDTNVFENAQVELNTKKEVISALQDMTEVYKQLLHQGRVRWLPSDYLLNQEILAMTKGALTPWDGDEIVLIPWNEDEEKLASLPGQTFESALAHEYVHVRFGPHSLGYMLDVAMSDDIVSESEWAKIAREHGDISYMISDLFWLIDEWAKDDDANTQEPRYTELADVYGISSSEVRILSERSREFSARETHDEAKREAAEWIASRRK